jgi:uncharacterized membrane protein YeaQ/YmgE (transglycosylase-associated protein family)
MLEFLSWIIFGVIVGVAAKLVVPGPDPGGVVFTILLGIGGALLGGGLGSALGLYVSGEPYYGWIMSIAGAVILLLLYRVFRNRRQPMG